MSNLSENTAAAPSDNAIIVAEHLVKTYPGPVLALDDFSVRVQRGEVLVVIGPSGSGKSTFLRCLNGLEAVDSGRIVVDSIPLDDNEANRLAIRREVGMVFQSFNLFPPSLGAGEHQSGPAAGARQEQGRGHRSHGGVAGKGRGGGEAPQIPGRTLRRPATARGHCPRPGPATPR